MLPAGSCRDHCTGEHSHLAALLREWLCHHNLHNGTCPYHSAHKCNRIALCLGKPVERRDHASMWQGPHVEKESHGRLDIEPPHTLQAIATNQHTCRAKPVVVPRPIVRVVCPRLNRVGCLTRVCSRADCRRWLAAAAPCQGSSNQGRQQNNDDNRHQNDPPAARGQQTVVRQRQHISAAATAETMLRRST